MLSICDIEKTQRFLERAKGILATGDFKVEKNYKNNAFDDEFPLKHEDKLQILRSLTVEDCFKIAPNDNLRYEEAEVYFFTKNAKLFSFGEEEIVALYLKMYITETKFGEMIVVISFHREGMYE